MSQIRLTSSDAGKKVEMAVGDVLVISLPENPTTGFRWAFDFLDKELFLVQNDEYTVASSSGVGGGGQRIFSLASQKSGESQIQLKRWREWEGDSSVRERFGFHVRIT